MAHTTPDGCVDVDEHERQLTLLADTLQSEAMALLGDRDKNSRVSKATGKELAAVAIRARRAAAELALARAERDGSRELLAQYARMHGHGDTARRSRSPLRRVQ